MILDTKTIIAIEQIKFLIVGYEYKLLRFLNFLALLLSAVSLRLLYQKTDFLYKLVFNTSVTAKSIKISYLFLMVSND